MKSIILTISGLPGSGKTTVSTKISNLLGWKIVSFGDYVKKKALQNKIEPSRENLQNLGASLISEHGWKNFCRLVLDEDCWQSGESIVIDGVRHLEALKTLKNITKPSIILHVHIIVDSEIREKRLRTRKIKNINMLQINNHSIEKQHYLLKECADLVIDGSKPIEEVVNEVILIIKNVE